MVILKIELFNLLAFFCSKNIVFVHKKLKPIKLIKNIIVCA